MESTISIQPKIKKKSKERERGDPADMYRLHMTKYQTGIKILKLMSDPDYIIKSPFSDALEKCEAKYIGREHSTISEHVVEYGGKKCRLIELVSNNPTTLYYLQKYSMKESLKKDRMALVLVPEEELNNWRTKFSGRHNAHIHFFPVKI